MHPYWLSSFLFATSVSAKAAAAGFEPRGLKGSTSTGFYYPTGTGTSIYPTHYPTGTGTAYSTVTPTTSYTYTPPPPPPPSSTSSLPPATPSTFKIQVIVENNPGTSDPGINNSYAYVRPIRPGEDGSYTGDDGIDSLFITPSFALASVFHLNADHSLQYGIEFAGNDVNAPGDPGGAYKYYLFESQAKIKAGPPGAFEKSVCGITNGFLNCRTGINYLDFTCGERPRAFQIESGPTERSYEDFCYPLGLKTVPILGPLV